MSASIRLTVVLTHPVQYYSPWFRYIASSYGDIDLTVVYATEPTSAQQGAGFGESFHWDVPLRDGYHSVVVRPPRPNDDVRSVSYRGLDVREIGPAVLATAPDVVLVPGWYSVTLARTIRACRRAGVPLLYRGDSVLQSVAGRWRRLARDVRARHFLCKYDAFLSVGTRAREYLARFGVPESRVFSSPHCVDNEFFAAAAQPHRAAKARAAARVSLGIGAGNFAALFVGKLEAKKRPLDLLRAIAQLGRGAEAVFVGAGPLSDECRSEARRLGVKVAWPGFLNQSELGCAYGAADCLVLPSDGRETWGLVVNEAMAAGVPCVVSDAVGSAPDLIVPGETGDTYPIGDVSALADRLAVMRDRTRQGHDWSPTCRKHVARFSFKEATEGLAAACRAVMRSGEARCRPPAPAPTVRRHPTRPGRVLACCEGMVVVFGLERMVFEALRVARDAGMPVHCAINDWENRRIARFAENIGATWSPVFARHKFRRGRFNPSAWFALGVGIARTSSSLLLAAARFRPTAVLIPELRSLLVSLPALAALRTVGVRTIYYAQNSPPSGEFYSRIFRRLAVPLVDHFVACSDHVSRELVGRGVPAEKVRVIYNVVPFRSAPVRLLQDRRDVRKVIFVGQVIPAKGLDLLIDAFGQLVREGLDIRLDVVGRVDGWIAPEYEGYRERLFRAASSDDLAGRVKFLGFRDDIPELMAQSGVHCAPSRPEMLEGLPLVVIEAKSAGIPSVSFDVPPFPEIITHDADGWICAEMTSESLADGLRQFLADPERQQEAGRAAQRSAMRFSRSDFAQAWQELFSGAALPSKAGSIAPHSIHEATRAEVPENQTALGVGRD